MRLSRPFFILIAGLLTVSVHAQTKRAPNYKNETAREADELERELLLDRQERKTARRGQQKAKPAQPGIPLGAPPAKPLGFSQVQRAPKASRPMRDFGRKKPKKIDRATANVFDAYMNSNAHNPALNARLPASQKAFQPRPRNGSSTYTKRPDPVVTGGGFNTGQGPYPENGGFSSKPVTLEQDLPPAQNAETPPSENGAVPAGPSN